MGWRKRSLTSWSLAYFVQVWNIHLARGGCGRKLSLLLSSSVRLAIDHVVKSLHCSARDH